MRRSTILLIFLLVLIVFVFSQESVFAQEAASQEVEGRGGGDINVFGMLKRIPFEFFVLVAVLTGMSLWSFCIALNLSYKICYSRKNLIRKHFERLASRKKVGPNWPSPVSMADNSPEIRN